MSISFGITEIFTFTNIAIAFLGVFVGIIIGALPGLTPTMGIALMLPFTLSMEPLPSFALLLGIYVGGTYGGSISAILIRTPGTPQAVATLLDGYPLARSGKASEALSTAVIASGFGGIFSNIVLILLAGNIAKVALAFGPAEYFAVGLFGLSMVASFCASGVDKGLFACGVGLLISTIGIDDIGGMSRFAYTKNMIGGIQTVSALIGLFALTEVITKAVDSVKHDKIEETEVSNKLVPGKEIARNIPNMFRSAFIGTFIGIVPATGGGIAAFLAYNEAKRASKHPEKFGTGNYEGVFAAETANNAVTGGALIPLLTLGVPGDTITAVLMGALTIQGLAPGPLLFENNPTVINGIYLLLLMSNIFMIILGLAGTRLFMHVIKIPNDVLLPCVMLLCFIGSYASGSKIFDMKTALVLGIVGFLFTLGNIPPAPTLLGIILGKTIESNMRRALVISNGSWTIFLRKPICLLFLILSIVSVLFVALRDVLPSKKKREKKSEQTAE